ncbi:MAG: hydroxymethylglutaryl-CoA reductase [Myxococcaceae bacterium]
MGIPRQLLRQLYTFGSLTSFEGGVRFELMNRLVEVVVRRVVAVRVNGRAVPLEQISFGIEGGRPADARSIEKSEGLRLPLRQRVSVELHGLRLASGHHLIELEFETEGLGSLTLEVEDVLGGGTEAPHTRIPRGLGEDYSTGRVASRQRFVEEFSGVKLDHLVRFSFDPSRTKGNIENFTGVAQVPMGFAGPIRILGEHAQGEFLVPMATTEGTLVASYNRGIKVLNAAGGVLCTVSADAMQRAPAFVFDSAREARDFCSWVDEHTGEIRAVAEATSSVAKLLYIDQYTSNRFAFLRFNFTTGDAAGQNMVGRATFAACQWILARTEKVRRFYLEANLATDKKHSHVNILHTRGKRVTAEATISRELLLAELRVTPEQLHTHASIGTIGAILAGASNNGAHSPNGITAMFIATGQDVANVAESSAGILYTEITPAGDLYVSLTIPSLIVATHGGGTGLPTQHECLQVLGCTERGSVRKLAEIMGGVALAGELSLGAAISSLEWVESHERMGRHR